MSPGSLRDPPHRPDAGEADFWPESRDDSLWPDTTRTAAQGPNPFEITRFDPAADERAASRARAEAAFSVHRPAVALGVLAAVQVATAAGALLAFEAGELPGQLALAAPAALLASLLWLGAMAALRPLLVPQSAAAQFGGVAAIGAGAALATGGLAMWAGLGYGVVSTRALGLAVAGAGAAVLVWGAMHLAVRLRAPAAPESHVAELPPAPPPGFLLGGLNSSQSLLRADPARAAEVLEHLGVLMGPAVSGDAAPLTLAEEIDFAHRYLAVEQVRLGHRLRVSWEIDPVIGGALVPPLVLLPLLERAVRHGVEPAPGGARLWLRALAQDGQAVVLLSNSVADDRPPGPAGRALTEIAERLRLLHGASARCDSWREGETHHARLVVPL